MPDSTLGSLLNDTNNVLTATTISGVGGIANYLYQVKKGEAFKLGMFCINAGLAAWLGYVATGFVDVDSKMF
jgi:hypothetical protein